MRYRIVVLGFLIIFLIVIAGCTSSQSGTATGSKSQNSGSESSTTSVTTVSQSSPADMTCQKKQIDAEPFKKFFPDISGFTGYPYTSYESFGISRNYHKNDTEYFDIRINILDLFSCNNIDSKYLNKIDYPENYNITSSFINYHGYPTWRYDVDLSFFYTDGGNAIVYKILVNPKMSVDIVSFQRGQGLSKSEADAEIEKFANAIDFNGIIAIGKTEPTPTMAHASRNIRVTVKYNPDGTITVTNNGGPDIGDLSNISVSVNGNYVPTNLDAKAGSVITVEGITGSKNRIIAMATFNDGAQQIVYDNFVGPNS